MEAAWKLPGSYLEAVQATDLVRGERAADARRAAARKSGVCRVGAAFRGVLGLRVEGICFGWLVGRRGRFQREA
jgi:hypothetical protein